MDGRKVPRYWNRFKLHKEKHKSMKKLKVCRFIALKDRVVMVVRGVLNVMLNECFQRNEILRE